LVVSLSLLMCLFLLIQKYPDIEDIFRGSYGAYKFLKPTDGFAEYLIKVLFGYMVSFLMCILVLNSVNDNKSVLTKWGDNSLTIFLFHPVFVFYLWKFRFFEVWKWDSQILFFFLLTIWISSVLGSNIFVKYTMYICNPYYSLIRLLTPLRKLIYNKTKS
jgi:fucose 4-O-acetylase-like acetyltransferase